MFPDTGWVVIRTGRPITETEWRSWLESTPGFSATNKVWGTNPRTGRPINVASRGAGLWVRGGGKADVYFNLHAGKIAAVDPDDEVIGKMAEIASALGGRLVRTDSESA